MRPRGWRFNGQQYPNAIHMCVTRPQTQPGVVEAFAADLAEAVAYARHPPQPAAASAGVYGGGGAGLDGRRGARGVLPAGDGHAHGRSGVNAERHEAGPRAADPDRRGARRIGGCRRRASPSHSACSGACSSRCSRRSRRCWSGAGDVRHRQPPRVGPGWPQGAADHAAVRRRHDVGRGARALHERGVPADHRVARRGARAARPRR